MNFAHLKNLQKVSKNHQENAVTVPNLYRSKPQRNHPPAVSPQPAEEPRGWFLQHYALAENFGPELRKSLLLALRPSGFEESMAWGVLVSAVIFGGK